jgi:hypothetical protein
MNPSTNESYHLKDLCDPEEFKKHCPDCEDVSLANTMMLEWDHEFHKLIFAQVHCVFTQYQKEGEVHWMQWYNLFGLYWGLFFFSGLSEVRTYVDLAMH